MRSALEHDSIVRVAINHEHVDDRNTPIARCARDRAVPADDGRLKCSRCVRIEAADFDIAAEIAALTAGRTDIGAVVTFTGLCRDEGGTLAALELEHYPGMAEAEIRRIARRGRAALAARRT